MKLKIHELKEPVSLSLNHNDGWVRDLLTAAKVKFKGPLSLHLSIRKDKDDLFFQGHLQMTYVLPCSRCAEDAFYPIDEFFSPIYTQGKEPASNDGGLTAGALDSSYFQGDAIDLGDVIREQILLFIPIQPLCGELCKGMCVHCGQNLNVRDCKCEKETVQSTFEILKRIKVTKSS